MLWDDAVFHMNTKDNANTRNTLLMTVYILWLFQFVFMYLIWDFGISNKYHSLAAMLGMTTDYRHRKTKELNTDRPGY